MPLVKAQLTELAQMDMPPLFQLEHKLQLTKASKKKLVMSGKVAIVDDKDGLFRDVFVIFSE
jgi:hypothetical protein